MSERIIITLATGHSDYGQLALNLALSIKANNPKQKTALIYTATGINGIEKLINDRFDYGMQIGYEHDNSNPIELAFYTKTKLYEYALKMCPKADEFIFMDADTLLLAGKSTDDWFDKHSSLDFTAYTNDAYYYSSKTRKRKDYTFWCDPEKVKEHYKLHPSTRLPQINSSWLYWKRSDNAQKLFDKAAEIWNDDYTDIQLYKGAKPDEFCFNVACAITEIFPHKNTYRPLFFQCFSESFQNEYVYQYFKGFGFAGNTGHQQHIIDFYNQHAKYYRAHFGVISNWEMAKETKAYVDDSPIDVQPYRKRTIYRAGELANSDCGVFNPSGILLKDGSRITIFRKEHSFDAYMRYKNTTAIPHLHELRPNMECDFELKLTGYENGLRLEDFRLFMCNHTIMCNHHVVVRNHTPEMEIWVNLAYVNGTKLCNLGKVNLPIETKRVEKNWVFFAEGERMYCIYSVAPYKVFYSDAESGWQEWHEHPASGGSIRFCHPNAISNSTNPIRIGDEYLMFFHTKEQGIYYKGAMLIDAETKRINAYTYNTLKFDARNDGMHKKLHYVSGAMYIEREKTVRVFYGENDSHACCMDYHVVDLLNAIRDNYAAHKTNH